MKLIKKGVIPEKLYEATCACCGAVWQAEPHEVEGFHRNEHVIYTKTCEECGTYGLSFKEKALANESTRA